MTPTTTAKIGKYEILGVLGQGGMGTVYRAFDRAIGREVAIKKLSSVGESPELLQRFYLEARSAGNLRHPNIVVIYDMGEEDGIPYMVMEFLAGESLDKIIAEKRDLPLMQKLDIVYQVCSALHYAHEHSIIHRDVKPANVILMPDGLAKLVDFGIVRAAGAGMTRAGQIVGTLNYMSPERLSGGAVDARTDVFSTGVLLYQLLTSMLPFDAPQTVQVMKRILNDAPMPLSAYLPEYPPDLDEIINRSLAKKPEDRYLTADDMAYAVAQVRDSLKHEVIDGFMARARSLMAQSDLTGAREVLSSILKIDTQYTAAKQLMREVQRQMDSQKLEQRVQSLREQAQQALAQQQFGEAGGLIDQALQLNPKDTELLRLRDLIQQAGTRDQQVKRLLRLAETAQGAGELEMANNAVSEALQLDPEDTQATVLHASLVRQIAEAAKKKQVRQLLNSAHQEISARHFTAAHELIHQAEAVDPGDDAIAPLKALAATGYQQEQRREEVRGLCTEIQGLITAGQFGAACERAASAMAKYSNEPALIQLQAQAENKREAAAREQQIREQSERIHQLMERHEYNEAAKMAQAAFQQFPGEARLQTLLQMVNERVQGERTGEIQRSILEKAREELGRNDLEAAQLTLETGHAQLPAAGEVADLLQQVRAQAAQTARDKKIENTISKARQLADDHEFRRAITLLERAQSETPDGRLETELQGIRQELENFNAAMNAVIGQAQAMMREGKTGDALTLLLRQPPAYLRVPAFMDVFELARRQHEAAVSLSSTPTATISVPSASVPAAAPTTVIAPQPMAPTPQVSQQARQPVPDPGTRFFPVPGKPIANPPAATPRAAAPVATISPANVAPGKPPTPALRPVPARAAAEASSPSAVMAASVPQPPPPSGAMSKLLLIFTSTAAVAGLGLAAWIYVHRTPAEQPAPAPQSAAVAQPSVSAAPAPAPEPAQPMGYIEITAQPWATVESVQSQEGKQVAAGEATPVRVSAPPGTYTATLVSPAGERFQKQVTVTPGSRTACNHVFDVVDARKIVNDTALVEGINDFYDNDFRGAAEKLAEYRGTGRRKALSLLYLGAAELSSYYLMDPKTADKLLYTSATSHFQAALQVEPGFKPPATYLSPRILKVFSEATSQ